MAGAVAAVVERVYRDSSPDEVERDLASLWRDIARNGHAVARAVMANLVVLRVAPSSATDGTEQADSTLESVTSLHPSRTIVIEHERGNDAAEAPSGARVGISVFGTSSAPYGVERIIVRSACADQSLASIVRRFVHGDRPTSVWWTEDLSQASPGDGLIEIARQLLYDSRAWRDLRSGFQIVGALARARRVDLADMNWRRLHPLRRALAHAAPTIRFDGRPRLAITYGRDEAVLAWLLAGWLVTRLKLKSDEWPTVSDTAAREDILTLSVEDAHNRLTARMDAQRVVVELTGAAPMTVAAFDEHPAESMAAELRSLSRDAALSDTLEALLERFTVP